jgi:hypothetical protein
VVKEMSLRLPPLQRVIKMIRNTEPAARRDGIGLRADDEGSELVFTDAPAAKPVHGAAKSGGCQHFGQKS